MALETNAEAYDVSVGLSPLRQVWVRARDTTEKPIVIHLSRRKLERAIGAMQVQAASMPDRLKAKPQDEHPEYIDMSGKPLEEVKANNNRRTIPNFMKSGLLTAAQFLIERAGEVYGDQAPQQAPESEEV